MTSFSIIIPTKDRPTLIRTLASVTPQIKPGDEILVICNDAGRVGPGAAMVRNTTMARAKGDYLLFIDDDDCYVDGALATIRSAIEEAPGRIHVFKMRYSDGRELWTDPEIRPCNVSTQMFVVPRDERLGSWTGSEINDHDFLADTATNHDEPAVFHEEVIALVRP